MLLVVVCPRWVKPLPNLDIFNEDLSGASQVPSTGLDVFGPQSRNTTVSGDVAKKRSEKYNFALGEVSPGVDKVNSLIQSPGGEDQLREMAASDEMKKRWESAVDLFKTGEATVDAQTMEDVLTASQRRIGTDSVLEKKFAERAMALSLGLTENPEEVNQSQEDAPVLSQGMYDAYVHNIQQDEATTKLVEDADAELAATRSGDYIDALGLTFIPLYTWSTQRNVLGERLSAWLPGSNLEQQYAYLRSMPADDYATLTRSIYRSMADENIVEANYWVHGLQNYNSAGLDDAFGVLDLLSLPGLGVARKIAGKGVSAVAGKVSTRKALSDARKATDDFNRVHGYKTPKDAKKSLQTTLDALESKRRILLDEMVKKQRSGNPMQAAVVESVFKKTTQDINELRKGLDEIAKLGDKKGAGPLLERLRRTSLAASDKHLDFPKMLSATGHIPEASRLQAAELAKKLVPEAGKTKQREIADLIERTPSLFNPQKFMLQAATFSGARAARILEALERNQGLFAQSINSVANVSRLPADLEQAALKAAEDSIRGQFTKIKDAILHVDQFKSVTDPFTNTASIETVFGKTDGTLFKDAKSALNTGKNRYGMDVSEKDIFQEGDGYVIRVRKDIDETAPGIRDALIKTGLGNESNVVRNKLFGFIPIRKSISGAKDTVSKFQAEQRAVTTHATVAEQMFVLQMAEPISRLSKTERNALDTIMEMNRDAGSGPNRGKFFNNVFELEEAYVQKHNRLPTENEATAYQAFVQNSDAQYLYLASQEIKEKGRKGIERMTLSGKDMPEFSFEGKIVDNVPFNSSHPGSVYYAPTINASKGKYYTLNEIRAEDQRLINKQIKDGKLQVIQTNNPEEEAIRTGLGVSGTVNFILVPSVKRSALRFEEQLPYRPGFHVKYKDEYFIKQPKIFRDSAGRRVYGGDTVALGVSNTAKAAKEVALLERARLAVKAKDDVALAVVINDGLPLTVKEVKQLFKTRFDVDTPFAVVKSGQSVADPAVKLGNGQSLQDMGSFYDFSNSPYNLSKQITNEFTGHKDGPLWSIKNSGTEDKPIWEMAEARTVSPIDTQIQAMGKLVRSKHYNDYQISAAESWVQEFGVQKGLVRLGGKPVSADDLRRNPGYYLAQGTIDGTDVESQTARNIQASIKTLVSHKSLLSNHISNFQAKLLSSAYERSGEKYIETIDNWSAFLKSDIPSKLRAIAFHTKLGLGNPVQVLLQGQTLFNISAIAPKHGPSATFASSWMRKLDLLPGDEAVARTMGDKMAKLTPGWTSAEFVESWKLLKRTGFDLIGGDLSWRNDIADPKLFVGKAGKFLEWSAGLFNGTERFVRIAAWNTAYKEYLEKFPRLAGKLTDTEAKTILSRAQDLSGNMTRDAHAFWQEGAASTITQFWGYTGRMFDLMTGMRLTKGEKARLMSGWMMLYGVPVGGTALLPIWPWKDDIREHLLADDTNPDEGVVGLVMNGMVSTALAAITGDHYDFGGRYGLGEIQVLKTLTDQRYGVDALDAISKIAMGASGSITLDIMKDSYPILGDLADIVQGGDTSTMLADANDLFSNVSSYKQASRAAAILNTGMYITKDNRVIDEATSPWEGIGHIFHGMEKLDVSNARAMENVVRDKQALQTQVRKDAKEYIRMYFQSINEGDTEQAKVYIKRARVMMVGGGLTEDQIIETVTSVGKEDGLLDTSKDKYIKAGETPESKILRQDITQ